MKYDTHLSKFSCCSFWFDVSLSFSFLSLAMMQNLLFKCHVARLGKNQTKNILILNSFFFYTINKTKIHLTRSQFEYVGWFFVLFCFFDDPILCPLIHLLKFLWRPQVNDNEKKKYKINSKLKLINASSHT